MGKHKNRLGWSLQQRGKTWFVYHRYTVSGKMVGKSTGKKDREEALVAALNIVAEARTELAKAEGHFYEGHLESLEIKAQEEELLLGKEIDKTNPRMTTLWTFGKQRNKDTGILYKLIKENQSYCNLGKFRGAFKFVVETHPEIYRINEVTPEHMKTCIERKSETVSPVTLAQYWGNAFRTLFRILIEQGWYHAENPAPLIKMSSRHRPKTIVNTISNEEVELLVPIFEAFDPAYGMFFQLGIHTGMRRTEIANLLWSDIDLDHKPRAIAIVRPHEKDDAKAIVRSTVKTRRSERIVPLKTELINYLRQHYKESGYVVESDTYRVCREQFDLPKKLMKQVREVCPQFHLHLMRHTFITNALMGGQKKGKKKQSPIPPVKVAMWVGDSVQMILDTYTHYIPDDSIDSF